MNIDISKAKYDDVLITLYGNFHVVSVEPSGLGEPNTPFEGFEWRVKTNPPMGSDLFTIDGKRDHDEPNFITDIRRDGVSIF